MSFSKVLTGALVGLECFMVDVEVNIDYQGMPNFSVVGLASKEIDEAKERVRSAIKNSGYQFPNRRITVNLAPADLHKRGSLYDLPIAVGILKACGIIKEEVNDFFVMGELSLNGEINKINGAIPLVLFAKDNEKIICTSKENAFESSIIKDARIKSFETLNSFVDFLNKEEEVEDEKHISIRDSVFVNKSRPGLRFGSVSSDDLGRNQLINSESELDFKYIKGQENAKRALEIAAAGAHNVALVGPPGSGKTLLAKSLVSILPEMNDDEALEVTKIYSIAGLLKPNLPFVTSRPFRAPHHSITKAGLLGGGTPISPGEITLAHLGVLFIDEFAELEQDLIESLREPIESKEITISRATGSVTFPTDFTLIVATNPCPCGNLGNPNKECTCYPYQIKKYQDKLSGPILDRIDLYVNCLPVEIEKLQNDNNDEELSKEIANRIQTARDTQSSRFLGQKNMLTNAKLNSREVYKYCHLEDDAKDFIRTAAKKLQLSARSYHKLLKVSLTIADLEKADQIRINHIAEALQYRFGNINS